MYVISVGLISEKIVKREEKRRKTTADRQAAACAFCENRVTRFREKRKKKNCWSGLIATWKSSWGERRLTGPRDRSSAKEHEWGGGKKATHVSRPIEWGESRASFPIQATCDTNSQIVDKGNGATGQRGGEKEKGDAFETFPGKRCGKRGERGERKSFWGINQVGIVN